MAQLNNKTIKIIIKTEEAMASLGVAMAEPPFTTSLYKGWRVVKGVNLHLFFFFF
jgi:hypothetical protein